MKVDKSEKRRKRIVDCFAVEGSIKGVCRKLGVSTKTVRKALRGQPLGRSIVENPAPRPSKLDPYKPMVQRLILDDKLTAVLTLEEIRALGYEGGHSVLYNYVRTIRPQPAREPTTLVEHIPGREGQVDWSPYAVEIGGESRIVHGFSLVLPWSRYMVLRFALDEVLETLIALHEESFAEMQAIPHLMTYDNMTTVGRHVGPGKVWLNPRFEQYSKQCDFEIRLIAPGKPNQHASVERPFHYVENNCLRRRRNRFESLQDLQAHAKWWCSNVANVRPHGTTRERPIDRLARERPLMRPLPSARPETFQTLSRQVGRDFCVRVDNSRYSVPPRFVGQHCTVRMYGDCLEIVVAGQLIAKHPRHAEPFQRHVLPEHEEQFKKCTPSRRLLEQAFLRLGNAARHYHEGLVAERGAGAGYHIQRILRMADRHGSCVVLGAMAQTARYGNFSADAVARVIAGKPVRRGGPRKDSDGLVLPPESVRRWLEGIDVEQRKLEDLDKLLDDKAKTSSESGKDGHHG